MLTLTNKLLIPLDSNSPFPALGNGVCDGGTFNTERCGWDDGDCLQCNAAVHDPGKIGDGYCDGGLYIDTPACNNDGQDCSSFLQSFPSAMFLNRNALAMDIVMDCHTSVMLAIWMEMTAHPVTSPIHLGSEMGFVTVVITLALAVHSTEGTVPNVSIIPV